MGLKLELLKNIKFHNHGLLEILLIIVDVKTKTLWLALSMARDLRLGMALNEMQIFFACSAYDIMCPRYLKVKIYVTI